MPLFNDEVREQLRGFLTKMKSGAVITLTTQEFECGACADARAFAEEFSSLSGKITLKIRDLVRDKGLPLVDKVPALSIMGPSGEDYGINFYGIPAGYEINSFVGALLDAAGAGEALPEELSVRIKAIDRDIHIQVIVSLSCPYCPAAVGAAHRMAFENPKIRADMVDGALFPHIVQRYNVTSVPKFVINETHFLDGAQPLEALIDFLEKMQ